MPDHALAVGEAQHVHHLGVAVHDDVRVCADDDDLSAQLVLADLADHQVVDEVVVQIVLRLIEHQRFVAVRQQERQHRRGAFAGGRLADRTKAGAVAARAVFHHQVVFREPGEHLVEQLRLPVELALEVVVEVAAEVALASAGAFDALLEFLDPPFEFCASRSALVGQVGQEFGDDASLRFFALVAVGGLGKDVVLETIVGDAELLAQRTLHRSRVEAVAADGDAYETVARQGRRKETLAGGGDRSASVEDAAALGAGHLGEPLAFLAQGVQALAFVFQQGAILDELVVLAGIRNARGLQILNQCLVVAAGLVHRRLPSRRGQLRLLFRHRLAKASGTFAQLFGRRRDGATEPRQGGNGFSIFRARSEDAIRQIVEFEVFGGGIDAVRCGLCRAQLVLGDAPLPFALPVLRQDRLMSGVFEAGELALHVLHVDEQTLFAAQALIDFPNARPRGTEGRAGFVQRSALLGDSRRVVHHAQQRLVSTGELGDLPLAEEAKRKPLRRDRLRRRLLPTVFVPILDDDALGILPPMHPVAHLVALDCAAHRGGLRQAAAILPIPRQPVELAKREARPAAFVQIAQLVLPPGCKPQGVENSGFPRPAPAHQGVEPRAELHLGDRTVAHVASVFDLDGFDEVLRGAEGIEGLLGIAAPQRKVAAIEQRETKPLQRRGGHLDPSEAGAGRWEPSAPFG